MRSLLILSFSPIAGDARVLKQVVEFSRDFEVTTCGYGPAPAGVADHVRIPDDIRHDDLDGRLITLRLYRRAYSALGAVRFAREALAGRVWDAVIANDVETVPLALGTTPRYGVHADLHEYSPLLHEEIPEWKRRISPYVSWLCATYLPRVSSATTVSRGLQREYLSRFGLATELVTNAAPRLDLAPTPVHEPIRLVHSGACLRNRALHEMIDGVLAAEASVTFDLYLTPNDPGYLEELRSRAETSDGRVAVHDPVPYSELSGVLNAHDLGVHILAPTNFNNTWALPNKLFDYVQARLGVLIGPTPEMAEFVHRFGIGAVADGFSAAEFAVLLRSLTRDDVARFKAASDAASADLSAETQVAIWRRAVDALFPEDAP